MNATSPACPACQSGTTLVRWEDIKGFECRACKGHCIRSVPQTKQPGELMVMARAAPLSPRALRCPDCLTSHYRVLRAGEVELDVCADCGGLFCDAGEATAYFEQARSNKGRGSALVDIVDGADVLELVFEIICKIGH